MEIIKENNLNVLIPKTGYLLKNINDNGEVLEDGTVIPPYLTDKIYLAKSITTLEQCKKIWEEVKIDDGIDEETNTDE